MRKSQKKNWNINGNISYDGEDIVIIEGLEKKAKPKSIKYYIGLKTYGVYKIENEKYIKHYCSHYF